MGDIITSNETQLALDAKESSGREFYKELRPVAQRRLKKIMLNSGNEKLAASIAMDVLDRAGDSKAPENHSGQIVITDSQVNLLMQVAKEIEK